MVSSRKKISVWWRRAGLISRIGVFFLSSLALAYLVYLQRPSSDFSYDDQNILVFFLVNLNIAILFVLIFLVGRNVTKLIFDRKRGILGTKLRLKLLIAFVGITIIPTAVLFFHSSGLIGRAMEGWFSSQVEVTVDGAVEIARLYYETLEQDLDSYTEEFQLEVQSQQLVLQDVSDLAAFVGEFRRKNELFAVQVFSPDFASLVEETSPVANIDLFELPEPEIEKLRSAVEGASETLFEESTSSQFIRRYASLSFRAEILPLVVTMRIRPEVIELFTQVKDSFREYQQLKILKGQIQSGFLLTLGMITGLILFAAIWFAFYLSRELTVPIQQLAGGMERIRRGDDDFQLRSSGDDELGMLVKGFNQMIKDLRHSREQIEARQGFIEGVISRMNVGIIVLSASGEISLVNNSARSFFSHFTEHAPEGRSFSDVAPLRLAEFFVRASTDETLLRAITEEQFDLELSTGMRKFSVSISRLEIPLENQLGFLIVVDDVTEITEAEKLSVWRDAAKRIAHEIKNPLTPIKLSAQRVQRIVDTQVDVSKVHDSLATILSNVSSIKRLADEFSNFARLPELETESTDVNSLVQQTLQPFIKGNDSVGFSVELAETLPHVEIDPEQFQRLIINLVANALASLEGTERDKSISVGTKLLSSLDRFQLSVADSGPGIEAKLRRRILEPYFTTKPEGSGLGLAIVQAIVSDHHGSMRVEDNVPNGAVFIIELPIAQPSRVGLSPLEN